AATACARTCRGLSRPQRAAVRERSPHPPSASCCASATHAEWSAILVNPVASLPRRMVIVLFTPGGPRPGDRLRSRTQGGPRLRVTARRDVPHYHERREGVRPRVLRDGLCLRR